ncbi:transposable element Tcb1 transposase [Trichonephila clavipes]|nr:transposable element Tcb1 transposase [Trichonephila clavipes]
MVIGLRREGWSFVQIAADTNRDVSTVHRLWRRWLEQGNVARSRGPGAARVTSAREDRRIHRQAVAAPQALSTSILQHVQDTLDVPISTRTVSRRLVVSGLHSRCPLRTLVLTPQRRRARLEWCRARTTWMTECGTSCSQMSHASVFSMIVGAYECGVVACGERSNPQ